jgi:hypothetical protein
MYSCSRKSITHMEGGTCYKYLKHCNILMGISQYKLPDAAPSLPYILYRWQHQSDNPNNSTHIGGKQEFLRPLNDNTQEGIDRHMKTCRGNPSCMMYNYHPLYCMFYMGSGKPNICHHPQDININSHILTYILPPLSSTHSYSQYK